MTSPTTLETVHAYFEALNWGCLQEAANLFAPEAAWAVPAFNASYRGPCGFLAGQQVWRDAFPDAWIELRDLQSGAQWATACFTLRGQHAGLLDTALGVVTPTGREIALAVCDVFDVAHGRITQLRTFFDAATLLRQLGMLPCVESRPFSLNLAN